jgi:hypothetical protein
MMQEPTDMRFPRSFTLYLLLLLTAALSGGIQLRSASAATAAATPNLGYFSASTVLSAAYPASAVPVGTSAVTGDLGPVWSNGASWVAFNASTWSSSYIPGTPTDAQLIANYPAASYNGYTATTSDLGPEQSNGTRWLILNPPVPAGAAALGLHTPLIIIHPVVSDINLVPSNGTPISNYFTCGAPGANTGCTSAQFTTTNGQLTLVNAGSTGTYGGFLSAATFNQNYTVAQLASGFPQIPMNNKFYFETASTDSNATTTQWDAAYLWTVEGQANTSIAQYVEYDTEENGFSSGGFYGFTQTLHNWPANSPQESYYSGTNVAYNSEQIWGSGWSPATSGGFVLPCFNGTCFSHITFASVNMVNSAWQNNHFEVIFGSGLHSGSTPHNMQVRYIAVWVAP